MRRTDELVTGRDRPLTVRVVTPLAGRGSEHLQLELSGPSGKRTGKTSLTWVKWDRLVAWVEWQRHDRDFEESQEAESKKD